MKTARIRCIPKKTSLPDVVTDIKHDNIINSIGTIIIYYYYYCYNFSAAVG